MKQETIKELKMKQTVKYKLEPTFEQEKHLHNMASMATKLYNTDNWIRRQEWEKTGKIPNSFKQYRILKYNHWYRLLPAQTSNEVMFNLDDNYKAWFRLKKKDKTARPPGFRKKEMLSPLAYNQQFKLNENKLRLSLSHKYKKEHKIKLMELKLNNWKKMNGKAKWCQILFRKGNWYAHIVFEVPEPEIKLNDKVMGIDLGIINQAVTADNLGSSRIYTGKGILAVQHYFNKAIANTQSILQKQYPKRYSSRTLRRLNLKKQRQINLALHRISRDIVNDCVKKDIKTLVVGDIKDIRDGKSFGRKGNQKLHSWSFSKLTRQLEYKSALAGIRFVKVSEKDTSRTCSNCNSIRTSNRIARGLYRCRTCLKVINADVNGAKNILKKYLQIFNPEDRSISCWSQPLVTRQGVVPIKIQEGGRNP